MTKTNHIIVHAGFHKTGTSSLQAYLQEYRNELLPFARIYIKSDLKDLSSAGRFYGQFPSLLRARLFRRKLRKFLSNIEDNKVIVISRETFCGIMPGHRRFGIWPARKMTPIATKLAIIIEQELRRRFGEDTEITLLYTTREKESWHKSVWGHIVRSINLKIAREEFVYQLKNQPSLDDEVETIRRNLKYANVLSRSLEELKTHPLGPAGAIIDLLELPKNWNVQHPPKTINNVGEPKDIQNEFLRLNRDMKNAKILKSQKEKIANDWRKYNGFKPRQKKLRNK